MPGCGHGDLRAQLSAAGAGDYWEDAEHFVRNQLQSNQVTASTWLEELAKRHPKGNPAVPPNESSNNLGALRVNLLLNRASKSADISSYLPYRGRVDINVKRAERLQVRIPSWVAENEIRCSLNRRPLHRRLNGRYLDIGAVQARDVVIVEFPLERATRTAKVFDTTYTLSMKGFNVVDISPRDANIIFPFYSRADYRGDKPHFKQVIRFVPANELNW